MMGGTPDKISVGSAALAGMRSCFQLTQSCLCLCSEVDLLLSDTFKQSLIPNLDRRFDKMKDEGSLDLVTLDLAAVVHSLQVLMIWGTKS